MNLINDLRSLPYDRDESPIDIQSFGTLSILTVVVTDPTDLVFVVSGRPQLEMVKSGKFTHFG
jgi:hypothetical protein